MGESTTLTARRRLLIEGAVSLSSPTGQQIRLRGVGDRLQVDVDSSLLSLGLLSHLPPRARRRRWLLAGQPALDLARLSVDLLVDGHPIGQYDWKTKESVLARLLGLGPVKLSVRQLLLALIRTSSRSERA